MKKSKILMLFLIIVLIASLFTGCVPTIPSPPSKITNAENRYKNSNIILDIPYFNAQGVTNGCGCAAGAMIMNYYNYLDVEPADLAPYIMVPESKYWETFGLLAGIEVYIKYYNYDDNLKTKLKILTIKDIKRKIDEGFPVAVLQYSDLPRITENLHYRVIHGYDDEKLEFICSCSLGEDYSMEYSEFINLNLLPVDKCPALIVEPKNIDFSYLDVVPAEGSAPHKVHLAGYVRAVVSPFSCQVDFGDGTPIEDGTGNEFLSLYHTYANEGKFTPVLYVEDNLGRKGKCKAEDVIVIPTLTGPVHNLTKNTYYNTIQVALDDANSGDTVEVSPGTYYENLNFLGKNITLRSTNPNDPSVVVSTIIDGGGNGSVVIFAGGETRQAVLKGLTIQNGNSEPGAGGGIMINNSSPTISGNIIRWNIVDSDNGGGGIFLAHLASPLIENNTIDGNQAGFGGGIYVGYNSSPTIRNNSIENNSVEIHRGGGIFVSGSSSPTIQDNSLSDNSSQFGGGICIVENSSGEISNNYFTLNTAQYGGGIFCGDSDPIIKQNEFSGNSATSFGGGLFIGKCVVNNNVISGNTAQTGGGIFVWESSPTISDNNINGNTSTMGGGGIYVRSNSHPTINNNIISSNKAAYYGGGICIDGNSSVKTTNGSTWPRQNTPPNVETTNTYFDNTRGNPPGYTEGADVYFENPIVPPQDVLTVSTKGTDYIDKTSAGVVGTINKIGGANVDEVGFEYEDLTDNITFTPVSHSVNLSSPGEFSDDLANLEPGHQYKFKFYAHNSVDGRKEGEWKYFTTVQIVLDAEITNITDTAAGSLIDPFELNKWYTAKVYIHIDYNGPDSGIIEVRPKPDSGIEYNPIIKGFPYDKYTLGGSKGFDYKFVGSGTTRQLTFELYDQSTGNKLDEYTSETLHLMQPNPHLEYIETVPLSTDLQKLYFFYFGSDYVIKAHFDDGHTEIWTNYNKFLFETSNENIAYVEEHGVVGGIGVGIATITVTYKEDTSKKAYLSVTVY